jgi:hypothetical protein
MINKNCTREVVSLRDYLDVVPHDPPLQVGEIVYPIVGGATECRIVSLLDNDRVQITWTNPDGTSREIDVASIFCLRSPSAFCVADAYGEVD